MKFTLLLLFEMNYHLRRMTMWIFFLVLLGLLLMVADEIVDYAQTIGGVLLNAPLTIADLTGFTLKFGLLLVAAMAGNAAVRDLQAHMDPLIYTKPINKYTYLAAKFMAVFILVTFMLLAATHLSILMGSNLFKAGSSLFGPVSIASFLNPFLILTLPGSFIVTAILFAVVLLTRNSITAFAGGVILFFISSISRDFGWETAKLLDPLGINIIDSISRTVTPAEYNIIQLPFRPFLYNRIIWITISLAILSLSFYHFKFTHVQPRKNRLKNFYLNVKHKDRRVLHPTLKTTAGSFHKKEARFYKLFYLGRTYYKEMFRSRYVLFLVVLIIFYALYLVFFNKGPLHYPVQPATERIISLLAHWIIQLVSVMFITIISGYLIWRERDSRMNEIVDVVPVSDSILLMGKFLTLVYCIITILVLQAAAGILVQVLMNHHLVQWHAYMTYAFVYQLFYLVLFAALAMAVQVIINQKYISYLLIILLYVFSAIPEKFGVEHKLLQFNSGPDFVSSVFYGYNEYFPRWLLFKLYWAGWAFLAVSLAISMWVRGKERSFRIKEKSQQLLRKPVLILLSLSLIFIPGGVIFYHTHLISAYSTAKETMLKQVQYEQLYSLYKHAEQPHPTEIELFAELYPEDQKAAIRGIYTLKNSHPSAIDSIHIVTASGISTDGLKFRSQAVNILKDSNLNYYIFLLKEPLQPGDSIMLEFNLSFQEPGFTKDNHESIIIENGTWLISWEILPEIGYRESRELSHPTLRKKYNLPEKKDYADLNNQTAIGNRTGNERVRYQATIGTTKNEIPVTAGVLVKTLTKGNRHYHQYDSEKQVLNGFFINSSAYKVRKSSWNGVELSIFHHPQHTGNLDNIELAMIRSLEYYSEQFSPYPHTELKFVETPDPGTGGISLPGYIGYSSNFSLLAPNGADVEFDLPFAVAAHEVAHQWWPHQLIPARVQGIALLTEGLAWYSAFGVIEKQYGPGHLANLLKAMHKDFLNPRTKAGRPLLKAIDKFYGYRKGPLALYALREYAGEDKINQALKNLLKEFGSGNPPYVTTLDFYDQLEKVIPDSLHYLLHDLIKENTYWNLSVETAEAKKQGNGTWNLDVKIQAQKVYVDAEGRETEAAMKDWVEIGIYDDLSKPVYLKKHKLHSGKNHIHLTLTHKPGRIGVDPRYLLTDAEIGDNWKRIYLQ